MINIKYFKDQSIFPLNSIKKLSFLLKTNPNDLKKIAKSAGNFYQPFDRKQIKENGDVKWRHIDNPLSELKKIQRKINKILLTNVIQSLPTSITGGRTNQSIFTNASYHTNQEAVVTIDLKDCFPKTNNLRIFKVWRRYLGNGEQVSDMLTKLTAFQRRLPQGAPTSSSLCNLVLLPLHLDILKYCNKNELNLSQFVDDITISGEKVKVIEAIDNVISIIQSQGYAARKRKVKVMLSYRQQKTTGLIVNKKISISKKFIENVRKEIIILSNQEKISENTIKSILGKINHIKLISQKDGDKLTNLAHNILFDTLDSTQYEKATTTKDLTRKCKHTNRHKYGK